MVPLYLVDTCQVERYASVADGYNNRKRVPEPHLQNVPCRYTEKAKRGFNSISGEWVTTTEVKLMVSPDVDVQTGDRITGIVLQDCTPIAGIFDVDGGALGRRGHMARHRTLILSKVG